MKKGVLKNFAKSTGKHLCQSLFFNLNIAKFLRTPFLQNTSGQLFLPCSDWILVDPGPSIVRIRTHIYFTMRITWIWNACITAQKNEEILNNKNHFLYSVFSDSREWWIWEHRVVYSGIVIQQIFSYLNYVFPCSCVFEGIFFKFADNPPYSCTCDSYNFFNVICILIYLCAIKTILTKLLYLIVAPSFISPT